MTIPQGAVALGQSVDIYLAVSRDDKDRPKLTGKNTSLCFHSTLNVSNSPRTCCRIIALYHLSKPLRVHNALHHYTIAIT